MGEPEAWSRRISVPFETGRLPSNGSLRGLPRDLQRDRDSGTLDLVLDRPEPPSILRIPVSGLFRGFPSGIPRSTGLQVLSRGFCEMMGRRLEEG